MKYNEIRTPKREVTVGRVKIGGKHPIAIQSMTNTDTHDVAATAAQIKALAEAGCDIVRFTVPDREAADVIPALKEACPGIPMVADIHFDYRIALACAANGIDKIRINPGNIGGDEHVYAVAEACAARHIPIRIGVNSGSVEKHLLEKYHGPTAEALAESAMYHASLLEKFDFHDIVISLKASDVPTMIAANRRVSELCDYPLHIGVTEAGSTETGSLKSAIGIGSLLCDGIGDTLRVSLTSHPTEEVAAAKKILSALGVEGQRGLNLVSCPTCGRTKIDLITLSRQFEEAARREGLMEIPLKVALMGCVVNGPGEAHEADIGIAGGIGEAVLFSHGEILAKIPEDQIVERLLEEIKKFR